MKFTIEITKEQYDKAVEKGTSYILVHILTGDILLGYGCSDIRTYEDKGKYFVEYQRNGNYADATVYTN